MNTTSAKLQINKEGKPTVNIPSNIFGSFYSLHTIYKNIEWSGYMFYDVVGTLEDPSNLIINVTDFILMDVGSAASTDIQPTGEQIADMFMDKPHLFGKGMCICHTHHSMNLFFSGTDTDTLLENAADFDMFLSIIVNHKDHPIAKISQAGTVESVEKYTYKLKSGFITKEPVTTTKDVIYIYDCNVIVDTSLIENELKVVDAIVKERQSKFVPQTLTRYPKNTLDFDWDLPQYRDKTFNGKQISLFEVEDVVDNMSIKDKTIELLKRCLLGIDAEEYTLQQAREEYLAEKKSIGGTLKELKKNVEDSLDEDLDDLFGLEICNPVIANEVITHLSIITNNSQDEKMIKTLIENKLK